MMSFMGLAGWVLFGVMMRFRIFVLGYSVSRSSLSGRVDGVGKDERGRSGWKSYE